MDAVKDSNLRLTVKRLTREARTLGAEDPATTTTSERIRKHGAQVVRKKYGLEAD